MSDAEKAADIIRRGGVAIFPTESSYGMGARITDEKAIAKVFGLKGRPEHKPIPVIAKDLNQMEKFAVLDETAKRLSRKFHPGPLTLIVDATDKVPKILSKGSIAFRITSNSTAKRICELVGEPITATSANISGEPPIYGAEKARKQFPGIFVVDEGELPKNPPSTIFDTRTGKMVREGPISEKEILDALD